jgi:hypothetical protein
MIQILPDPSKISIFHQRPLFSFHIAGASPKYLQRAMKIIEHNLQAYVSRTDEMMGQVDFAKGY